MNPQLLLAHFDRIGSAPDAIPRLRSFVLDLAVRGRLVAQDPNDEPASVLLERIQLEKERMVTEGKIRRQELSPPIENKKLPFQVPPSWRWVRLADLSRRIHYGFTASANPLIKEVRLLRITDIQNNSVDWNGVPGCEISKADAEQYALVEGDILIARTGGTIGKTFLVRQVPVTAIFASYLIRVQGSSELCDQYLKLFLESPVYWKQLQEGTRGTGQPNVNGQTLGRMAVTIPPSAEQRRIVTTVHELMTLCDQLEAAQVEQESRRHRLAITSLHYVSNGADAESVQEHADFFLRHLPRLTIDHEQIKELRQTVLNLAVRGQLIRQDPGDEPASELLKLIKAEKSRLVEGGGLKKDKTVWDGLPREPPHKLPSSWIWTCLQDVFEISRGGSPRPAGDPRYFGGNIPWITVGEVTKDTGKYLTKTETGLTEEGAKRSRFINSGDLLLTNSGATLGVPKISRIRACMNDGVAVLRLFHSVPLNEFAYLYLQSQTDAFRRVNQGMGQPNLNTPIIAGWFFPLPPLAEQHRIIAKVDELMALCDQLEAQLATSRTESRRLLGALLNEALNDHQELDGRRRALNG
jgi:type I restriction enzyme S subunit